jgi:hypothetical protein
LANHNSKNDIAIISDWIEQMSKVGRIQLDWPASVQTLAPLISAQDSILGIVIAISDPEVRSFDHHVAILGDCLPEQADTGMLVDLCLPLSADIQTAMLKWEIARFAACRIGLKLPAGQLFLVESHYDEMPTHEHGTHRACNGAHPDPTV